MQSVGMFLKELTLTPEPLAFSASLREVSTIFSKRTELTLRFMTY